MFNTSNIAWNDYERLIFGCGFLAFLPGNGWAFRWKTAESGQGEDYEDGSDLKFAGALIF